MAAEDPHRFSCVGARHGCIAKNDRPGSGLFQTAPPVMRRFATQAIGILMVNGDQFFLPLEITPAKT
jgi:hypothetical protein